MHSYCEFCKQKFDPYTNFQKFCCFECKDKAHIQNINAKWIARDLKEKKRVPAAQALRFMSSHAYFKEPSYLKRFKGMRG
jgi:hypothetical protein